MAAVCIQLLSVLAEQMNDMFTSAVSWLHSAFRRHAAVPTSVEGRSI